MATTITVFFALVAFSVLVFITSWVIGKIIGAVMTYNAYRSSITEFAERGVYQQREMFTDDFTRQAVVTAKIPFLNEYVYKRTVEKLRRYGDS